MFFYTNTFDDYGLVRYLIDNQINHKTDTNGFIDLLPDAKGKNPSIYVPRRYDKVAINRLRSSGSIWANYASSFQANALELVKGSLWINNAAECQTNVLQEVEEYVWANKVYDFKFDALQRVGKTVDARNAQSFQANSLKEAGENIIATNAREFNAASLIKSGMIFLNENVAKTENNNFIFSDILNADYGYDIIGIFNKNTGMVRSGRCREVWGPSSSYAEARGVPKPLEWMSLDNAREIVQQQDIRYPRGSSGPQRSYLEWFTQYERRLQKYAQ